MIDDDIISHFQNKFKNHKIKMSVPAICNGFDKCDIYRIDDAVQRHKDDFFDGINDLITDEEKEVVSDCMDLGEYYKVRTRDGIIEHLTKIHESDSNGNGSSSSGDVTDEIAGMMNKAESSLNFA